jgi:PAS domain S-box-containing protein
VTLFQRFFLLLVLAALLPVLGASAFFLRSGARAEENARQLHHQLTRLTGDAVELELGRMNRALSFAKELNRPNLDEFQQLKLLQQTAVSYPNFSLLSVLDPSMVETVRVGDTSLFPGGQKDRSAEQIVRRARETGTVKLSPVRLVKKEPVIALAYPLRGNRTLYAVYNLARLWERVQKLRVGSDGRILLASKDGRPLPAMIEGFPAAGWEGPGPLAETEGWLAEIDTPAGVLVGAYSKTPSLPWRVLTLQRRIEAVAIGEGFYLQAFLFLFLLAGAAVALAYWVTRQLTTPLELLVEAAKRASRHEFDARVPELGWGELNLLSHAFNELMGRLKDFEDLHVERVFEEKARVDSLVHTIPDGILMAGFDGQILTMNAAARELLGLEAGAEDEETPVHKKMHEVLSEPKLRDLTIAVQRRKRKSGTAEFETAGTENQSSRVYIVTATTVTKDDRDVGILVLMRDVTAERELEKMKEEFFHSIVHDLRGPIGTIDGFVQIMKERSELTEKEKMYIGYIRGSCDRLKQLVSDILDTAKIESGQISLKPEAVTAEGVLERMKALYLLQAETKGIQLKLVKGDPPPTPLECDKELTERVVMNLIGNALKFTPRGGVITLTIGYTGEEGVEFEIADTGPGIPKSKLESVFEKFKQLEGGVQAKGYGLGLSICKKVIELHGGRIWVESEEGQGSRFKFRLPLKPKAQEAGAGMA